MLFIRPAAALLTVFLITAPSASAGDWFEYKSENFTIYSDVSQKHVERLLRDLEKFRMAAHIFTEFENKPEKQQLKIFHFSRSSELKRFTGTLRISGIYRGTWDGPVILSRKRGSMKYSSELMFHEYTHHLMRERGQMYHPKWYAEGFAKLLETAEIGRESVRLGDIPRSHLGAGISHIDVGQLLQPNYESDSGAYWANYYMGAWLLTHYLELGHLLRSEGSRSKIREYLLAVKSGADPLASFESHFGKSPDELQRELQQYLRGKVANIVIKVPHYDQEIASRKLPDSERSYLLAEIAFHSGREDNALEYLSRADMRDSAWQANLSLAAVMHTHNDEFGTAAKLVARVESGELSDHRTSTNLAHYYVDLLEVDSEQQVWIEERYKMAVHYARAAIELNPLYLPAYRYLWSAQQQKGEREEVVKTMMSAYGRFPNNPFLNKEIALYLVGIGRREQAIPFLKKVVAWSRPGQIRSDALKMLQSLEAKEDNSLPVEVVNVNERD